MKNDIGSGVEVVYIYIYTIQYSESNDGVDQYPRKSLKLASSESHLDDDLKLCIHSTKKYSENSK